MTSPPNEAPNVLLLYPFRPLPVCFSGCNSEDNERKLPCNDLLVKEPLFTFLLNPLLDLCLKSRRRLGVVGHRPNCLQFWAPCHPVVCCFGSNEEPQITLLAWLYLVQSFALRHPFAAIE